VTLVEVEESEVLAEINTNNDADADTNTDTNTDADTDTVAPDLTLDTEGNQQRKNANSTVNVDNNILVWGDDTNTCGVTASAQQQQQQVKRE